MSTGRRPSSWSRLRRLIWNIVLDERREMWWYGGGLVIFLVVLPLLLAELGRTYRWALTPALSNADIYCGLMGLLMLISAVFKAVHAFPEIRNKASAAALLTLPAAGWEKVLARYLVCSVGVILFNLVICGICLGVLAIFLLEGGVLVQRILAVHWGSFFWGILAIQGFYLVGGLYFRRNPILITTVLLLLLYILLFGLTGYFLHGTFLIWHQLPAGTWGRWVNLAGDIVIYLLCLATTYYRIKELEIDEV